MKTCNKCQIAYKDVAQHFHRRGWLTDGSPAWASLCKMCCKTQRKQYYERNRDKELEAGRQWKRDNYDKMLARMREYYQENVEWMRERTRLYHILNPEYSKQYRAANKDKSCAKTSKYNTSKLKALPPWADLNAIETFYSHAQLMSKYTGITHHVDHIDPLQHPLVCGLHIAANLRVVTANINHTKGNKFTPYVISEMKET